MNNNLMLVWIYKVLNHYIHFNDWSSQPEKDLTL